MSNNRETPYTETELLLAVMNNDSERAEELVGTMSETERLVFFQQVGRLRLLLHSSLDKRSPVPGGITETEEEGSRRSRE